MSDDDCDWTVGLPQTAHIRFFRNTDWSRTRLGPLKDWSPALRLFAGFVLVDSRAACLWWGPTSDLIAIYNEAYAPLAGTAHPKLMGQKFQEGYPELWPAMRDYFDQAKISGTGVSYSSAQPLVVERKGWREETFFTGSFVPVGMPAEGFLNST